MKNCYERIATVLIFFTLFSAPGLGSEQSQAVRVMTVAMAEWEADPQKWTVEGSLWVKNEKLNRQINVPGIELPVVCNDSGHCLVVTGIGSDTAAASIMALGLNPHFDLTKTYFLIAGIAGTPPRVGTLGTVAWAEWVVNADATAEIDMRELPEGWPYSHFRHGCEEPWCDRFGAESGVYHLNPQLTDWAFRMSKDVELLDNEEAQEYRKRYPSDIAVRRPPSVMRCDSLAGDSYWHGKWLSEWAEWWVKKWTNGGGTYCMTNMEDFGTLTALRRLSGEGRVDWNRIMLLRAASNLDQQHPGQKALESLNTLQTGGLPLALENAYRVGSVVTKHILKNWEVWEKGIH